MPLIGTLSTMPLPDLLQWLGAARHTGILQIERNKVIKWIVFRGGRVVGCSSDDPPERLGHFLLSRGKITEDHLREALRRQETTREHLGRILVGMGVLSDDDLNSHLTAKSEETVYSIFDWDNAVFRFEEGEPEVKHLMPVDLQVEDLLLRGLRRYDEMRLIREVFDDPGIVLRQTPRMPPPEVFHNKMARRIYESINGERTVAEILLIAHGSEYVVTKFLFELYRSGFVRKEGRRDVEPAASGPAEAAADAVDAALLADAGERESPVTAPAEGAAATGSLVAPAGEVRRAHPTPDLRPTEVAERRGGVEVDLATARHLMSRNDFQGALRILDAIYQSRPQDESLRRLMAEAEAAFVEKAYRHYLPADHVPVLTRPVEDLEAENLSPSEVFLLSRIDGTWDVRSIIQIAPLREIEALRTLKRMRESGIIELRAPREE